MDKLIEKVFKERSPDVHKGDFGKLLVIGGSKIYTGAPGLSALAALNCGCDVVTVAAATRAADTVACFSPNLITYPLDGDYLRPDHVDALLRLSEGVDAVVIGSGLATERMVFRAVVDFLSHVKVPCVIDADAIRALGNHGVKLNGRFVVTAHRGEFLALTGVDLSKSKDVKKDVLSAARKSGAVILLKGHEDVISDGKDVFLNTTGNPYMTKGGTGDVLAGICGALLARGVGLLDAARLGAFISGAAGDIAAAVNGESLLATDVIDSISSVVNPALLE